jgi:phosphohistidine phosphatase
MKLLTLFRHAKSVQDPSYPIDRERPLAPRGREDAPLIARMMARADVVPQLIVVSPALRTRETSRLFASAAGYKGAIPVSEALYLGAAADLMAVVLTLPDDAEHAMLVGHNPGLEEFAALLIGAAPDAAGLRMPTGAAAHFELPVAEWAQVEPGRGTLLWLANPRLIKKLC